MRRAFESGCVCLVWLAVVGCDRQAAPPPASPPVSKPSPPAPAPPTASAPKPPALVPTTAPDAGAKLRLDGLELQVPAGWIAEAPQPGPMAPKAVYRLPKTEGDAQDGTVRITYFPEMKGKDEANIQRWLGQVRRADGQPATREDAKISVTPIGSVKVTLFDITGMVSSSMDGSGAATPNQRLINAILDHPKGPHFVRASGSAATMERWAASIEGFAKSAMAVD